MEGVDPGGQQLWQVVQVEAAADQDLCLVSGLAGTGRLGQERRDARVHSGRRTRREERVEAGQVRELLAQGVAVGGPVDRPVERPRAAVQLGDEPFDGDEVGVALRVEEAEHERVGPRLPHLAGLAGQYVDVTGGEAVRHPEHDAQRDVHGGPDRREGLP